MSILFTSQKNFMKRDSSSGSDTMLGPNTSRFFGSFYTRDYAINHNLGYAPMFRAFYEPYGDGRIMEIYNDTQYWLADPPNDFTGTEVAPTIMALSGTNTLTLRMFFINNTLETVSYPIYWVIYRDYGMEA